MNVTLQAPSNLSTSNVHDTVGEGFADLNGHRFARKNFIDSCVKDFSIFYVETDYVLIRGGKVI